MKKLFTIILMISIAYICNAQTTYLQNECDNPNCYYLESGNAVTIRGWNEVNYKSVYYYVSTDSTISDTLYFNGKPTVDIRTLIEGGDTTEACYDALLQLYMFHEFIKKDD